MNVREFLVAIPSLCGAKNAERIAEIFGFVFDRELERGSVFDRDDKDREDLDNRSSFLWAMLVLDADASLVKVRHCQRLVKIIELSHYLDEHGEKEHEAEIEHLYCKARADEKKFAEIAAQMPADEAVALGGWNF